MVEGVHDPEYCDFHALRYTYITLLGRCGVDLRTAQELAGHSTSVLTAKYMHQHLEYLSGAVLTLPLLTNLQPRDFSMQPKAIAGESGCTMAALTEGNPRPSLSSSGNEQEHGIEDEDMHETPENMGDVLDCRW